jgi:hypothetical protein|nr:MAG TPA: hypothetical protein [Crassvirales sp.]
MHNLPTEDINYNDEPVFYCKSCLSLRIRAVPGLENAEFCDECNSTDIGQCSIEEWRTLYRNKYGFDFLEKDY